MTVGDQIKPWALLIKKSADLRAIDPYLLGGLVITESGGQQYAQRVERGFWTRYGEGILRWVKGTTTRADDKWVQYPDIYCSSMGLCQVMLQTAVEHGFTYAYPGELFDPERNLEVACKILSKMRDRAGGDMYKALLFYNGGGDPEYPVRVYRARTALLASGVLW